MVWIRTVPFAEATGKLKRLYERITGPDNNVDNIMLAHSLRPHSMEGHMTLYKYVLHHPHNTLPKWYLEAIGVYVSHLNRCGYCYEHHLAGMRRLVADDVRSDKIAAALSSDEPGVAFSGRELAGLHYARQLTRAQADMTEDDINALREAGYDDGEILEINQVTAYFAYANRMVLGLGVDTEGDVIGLSPGDNSDPDNWSHA
ncbi:MAG: peroxidase-related enzyme [Pseudomonadota bacterium]